MEHFQLVLSICRSALSSNDPSAERSIAKLKLALEKQGANQQADSLDRLLLGRKNSQQLRPSRVLQSADRRQEGLPTGIAPPADRETSVPLAELFDWRQENRKDELFFSESISQAIDELLLESRHADRFAELGVQPSNSLLLYGLPGTGKTELAHSIASSMELPAVVAKLDGLISSLLGTTAKNISALFDFADRYRCVLVLDEFDAIAKVRDDPHELGEIKRVVNTLLQCLDHRRGRGFTIAITNHEHLLDSAVWRRFDSTIRVPVPDQRIRKALIEKFLEEVEPIEAEVKFLAWVTDQETGAQVQNLCMQIKKHIAIHGRADNSVLRATIAHSTLSGEWDSEQRQVVATGSAEKIVRKLLKEGEPRFTQTDLALLTGANQSTISRWARS